MGDAIHQNKRHAKQTTLGCFFCLFLTHLTDSFYLIFWLHLVFLAAHGLFLAAASRGYFSLLCPAFSLQRLFSWSTGSGYGGFSCCARACLLCGMWDLPGPGIECAAPALAGGFVTNGPPGKYKALNVHKLHNVKMALKYTI